MNDHTSLDTTPQPVKLRIADFLTLEATGAFDHYAKTELLDGEIFCMNAQHRPHAWIKMEIYNALRDALREAGLPLTPLVEASVSLPEFSIPEPDIVLTSEPRGEGFIPLASVALFVEVSDTTVKNDLNKKAKLYSRAGIPEYWVVDIPARKIHQMWSPNGERFGKTATRLFGEQLTCATLPLTISLPV